jgi:Fic family protein
MFAFLNGLDTDLRGELNRRMRELWIHGADEAEPEEPPPTGETPLILELRVKPCGHPLEEYQRDTGHLNAIRRVLEIIGRPDGLSAEDLFALHRILMARQASDPLEPVGDWKAEPNGAFIHDETGECVYYQYADPADVPNLMNRWLMLLNRDMNAPASMASAAESVAERYARLHLTFVWIHPFFDGNGRMARLLSNVPVLKAGFPPILISGKRRGEYLRLLDRFKFRQGRANRNSTLEPPAECVCGFCEFCKSSWRESLDLLARARKIQSERMGIRRSPERESSGGMAPRSAEIPRT